MFEVLVASNPGHHRERTAADLAVSLFVHTAIILTAIHVTGLVRAVPAMPQLDTLLMFLQPAPEPEPEPARPEAARAETPALDLVVANPPPRGFQTIVAPDEIPTEIPPVDLNERALDPRDFTGRGVEGGVSWGVVGGTGVTDSVAGRVYEAATTLPGFSPARTIRAPDLRYPPLLEKAGVPGTVMVTYIIDTLGVPEPGSVKVIETSHPLFAQAAIEAVKSARFEPAHVGRTAVRQLSQQRMRFTAP